MPLNSGFFVFKQYLYERIVKTIMEQTNNLRGFDALKRAKSLMTESTQKEGVVDNKNFKLIKEGADGKVYAIVKENSKYFIKKSTTNNVDSFDYLLGVTKKGAFMFESFSRATNSLNNILVGLRESVMGDDCNVNQGKGLLTNDIELDFNEDEEIDELDFLDDDSTYSEEDIDVNGMLDDYNPLDDMEDGYLSELDEMTEYLDTKLNEKYMLKVDSPKTEAPADFGSEDEEEEFDMDFGGEDDSNTEMSDESEEGDDENPFGEPFDAGVEANEEEDPKKFLQQLAGKLATSLREYQKENGDDEETKKFVANSVLSAIDTEGMDDSDINDIKDKLEAPANKEGDDESSDKENSEEDSEEEMDFDMDFSDDDESSDKEINEELEISDEEVDPIDSIKKDFNTKPSTRRYEETPEQLARKERYKKMDLSKPVDHPVNQVFENFNQNVDQYLASMLNPGIFASEEKKTEEMTETKPEVKPKTTPTETPSRRQAPFRNPGVKPGQPKFGK